MAPTVRSPVEKFNPISIAPSSPKTPTSPTTPSRLASRASSVRTQLPPQVTNKNVEWIGSPGAWVFVVALVLLGWLLFSLFVESGLAWTYVHLLHGAVSYYLLHWNKGSPIEMDQGKYDYQTFWEQLDGGMQHTPNRKFFTAVPVVLFLLATHGSDFRKQPLGLNLAVLILLLVAKFPAMHKPCSGKSTIAGKLADHLRSHGLEVTVVSEDVLGLERNAAYKDASSEKQTRGLLKSAVDRALRGDRVVVLDSLNNIKGYRYELWCIAKAAGTRYCVLHCETMVEVCRAWNERRQGPCYSADLFSDLAGRFEAPDTRNRWDTPLIRVDPCASSDISEELGLALAAVTGQPAASSLARAPEALTPNLATKNPELSTTNLLNELDRSAQEVVSAVMDAQAQVGGEAAGSLQVPGVPTALVLRRPVLLPELRRHKRAFLKLATQNNWTRLRNATDARRFFVEYLQHNLDP